MIESQYTQTVHKHLSKEIYRWKINDSFQGGIADAYYSGTNGDLWIEYKYLKSLPKKTSTQIIPALRSLQKKWLNARYSEGRNIAVIVGSPDGSIILASPKEWTTGLTCEEFKERALTRQETADWIAEQCLDLKNEKMSTPSSTTPMQKQNT